MTSEQIAAIEAEQVRIIRLYIKRYKDARRMRIQRALEREKKVA